MTRPPRQITEDPDVLTDPTAHRAHRPGWTCEVDGDDWPCPRLQRHMLAKMTRSEISASLAAYYVAAVQELDLEPGVVHARFFAWHRPGLLHAPGGMW